MRFRSLLVLLLAVALGAGSVFLARQWLAANMQVAAPENKGVPLTTVVVARTPLGFGTRLAPENLKEVQWPADTRPEGSFGSIAELIKAGEEERVVLQAIAANEPILGSKISGFGGRATLSAVIADDKRAITIRVNDVLGVAGFVLPGDRVDVLLTREIARENPITDILLQNVKVLGVDQKANERSEAPVVARAVTLEVSPVQAQKLTLGQTVGTLSLSLRNMLDSAASEQRTVTLKDLRVGEIAEESKEKEVQKAEVKPAPRRSPALTVGVGRGMSWSRQEVVPEPAGIRARRPVVVPEPEPEPEPAPQPLRNPQTSLLVPSSSSR